MLARNLQREGKRKQYGDFAPRTRREVRPRRQTLTERRVGNKKTLRRQWFVHMLVAYVMAGIITMRSGMIAARGYELGKIQEQTMKLEIDNAQLRVDNAKLKSPQRIKDIAAGEYGMTTPTKVYFSSDKNVKKN